MKRAGTWLILATMAITIVPGCGSAIYEARLSNHLAVRKEKAKLDKFLNPPLDGKYKEEGIFLRVPRPLPGQPAEFRLAAQGVTDANYDLHNSFVNVDQSGGLNLGLHVLGRHKKPKPATAKNAPAPDVSQRGDFTGEVLALANEVHQNAASQAAPGKVKKKTNDYTRYLYQVGDNTIEIYLFNRKFGADNIYDLALIWEYPTSQKNTHSNPIELCLQSMAVGPGASRSFESGGVDDSAGQDAGGAAF